MDITQTTMDYFDYKLDNQENNIYEHINNSSDSAYLSYQDEQLRFKFEEDLDKNFAIS